MKLFKILPAFTLSFFVIIPTVLFAADTTNFNYQILAPIGKLGSDALATPDLASYVNWLFTFGIGAAGVLAVIYIIIGGAQYATSDSITGHSKGRERIKNALIGLAIAIFSYLILKTINPDLLSLKFFSY